MKKKIIATSLILSTIVSSFVGVIIYNANKNNSQKVHTTNANLNTVKSKYYNSEAPSDTGLLNSNLKKHLNKQGLTDEEIESLSEEDLNSLSNYPSPSDIKLSKVSTKNLSISLITYPANKEKTEFYIKAVYHWNKIPLNNGYELLKFGTDTHYTIFPDNTSAYYTCKYNVYRKINTTSPTISTKLVGTVNRTYNIKNDRIALDSGLNSYKTFNVKTPKMVSIFAKPLTKTDLAKSENKDLRKLEAHSIRATSITYVVNALAKQKSELNSLECIAAYYHQIKNENIDYGFSASHPMDFTLGVSAPFHKTYQQLPSGEIAYCKYKIR